MFGLWFKKNEIYCGQKGFSEAGEQDCQEVPVLEENNRSEGYKDYWDGRSRISLACFDWYQHLLEYNLASFIFLLCSTVFSYKCSLQRQENLWICNRNLCACLAAPAMSDSSPLSMGFSRQENWSGSPSPPPGDLPNSGIKPASFMSPALAGGYFTTSATWEARWATIKLLCYFAFKSFKKNYGSILDLQCCISIKHTEKWITYAFEYIHHFLRFYSHIDHYRALNRGLCATRKFLVTSLLYRVVYISVSSSNLSIPPSPPW